MVSLLYKISATSSHRTQDLFYYIVCRIGNCELINREAKNQLANQSMWILYWPCQIKQCIYVFRFWREHREGGELRVCNHPADLRETHLRQQRCEPVLLSPHRAHLAGAGMGAVATIGQQQNPSGEDNWSDDGSYLVVFTGHKRITLKTHVTHTLPVLFWSI